MTNISNDIRQYYLNNLQQLPADKQFHFASRLYLWNQSSDCRQLLDSLRADFTAKGQPRVALEQIIAQAKTSPVHGSKNAAELRRPYFEAYPMLKTYVSVLFRIHFLKLIYGIDARQMLFELFDRQDLEQLKHDLLADAQALAILSTHAINFLYLYERSVKQDEMGLPVARFLEIGHTQYDKANKLHLQLLVYLYTHCIIGESLFYGRKLPTANLGLYQTMLQELEQLITSHYDDINLDNKCEFLVCARIAGLNFDELQSKIFAEAGQSISADGTFLVDKHNNNPQTTNADLDKSEHRNVLFIMANADFRPLVSLEA